MGLGLQIHSHFTPKRFEVAQEGKHDEEMK